MSARGPLRVANASGYSGDDPEALAAAAGPRLTADLTAPRRAGTEGHEGMAAFLEKRRPRWTS